MKISEVSVPEVYKESGDFRFFLKWFEDALTKVHYDTENLPDLYDPTRCPEWLLWMLADTMGFKFDDRLPTAFNRLVLLYFMSMIRNKGSKDGVTLAAETNLAQFNIINYGKEKEILNNRLEDTSIPVNSVYVSPHVAEGYIDVVYFSTQKPIDACIEYVRPVGMYLAQYAGVRFDARDKISVDARLTNTDDLGISTAPTFVGHYSRKDYASMQRIKNQADLNKVVHDPRYEYTYDKSTGKTRREQFQEQNSNRQTNRQLAADKYTDNDGEDFAGKYKYRRENVWYRNSESEGNPTANSVSKYINPGLRAMHSLQLCNNEHIVDSLLDPIFGLGYLPQKDAKDGSNYAQDPNNKGGSNYTQTFTVPDDVTDTFMIARDVDTVTWIKVNGETVTGQKTGRRAVTLDVTPSKGDSVQIRYKADYVLPDEVNLVSSNSADQPPASKKESGKSWWQQGIADGSIQVSTHYPGKYPNAWNLRYDKQREEEYGGPDVYTIDEDRSDGVIKPRPAVNPVMATMGDAISMNDGNTQYTIAKKDATQPDGYIREVKDVSTDGKGTIED